jgi:hypothetical protein
VSVPLHPGASAAKTVKALEEGARYKLILSPDLAPLPWTVFCLIDQAATLLIAVS